MVHKGLRGAVAASICGQSMMGIVSGIVIIWLLLSAAIVMTRKHTPYGRRILPSASMNGHQILGHPDGRIMFSVYTSAVFTALATSWSGTREPVFYVGSRISLTTIASVVTEHRHYGRQGGYIGTFAGAIMITVLNDFDDCQYPDSRAAIAQGLIILALVLISRGKKHNQ